MEFNIMRNIRIISLVCFTVFLSACQIIMPAKETRPTSARLQGQLSFTNQQWQLQPCSSQQQYRVNPSTELEQELKALLNETSEGVFADLSGYFDTTQTVFTPTQRYRLQSQGHNCDDPDFARLILRASGNEPFWSILQTPRGLILNQPGEPAVALPYIEEQLPNGRFNISSQANNQHLQLWITPQQCIDSMSGAVYHLSAQLQWNQHNWNGCATFGALRD